MSLILFTALFAAQMSKRLYKAILVALHINHKTVNLILLLNSISISLRLRSRLRLKLFMITVMLQACVTVYIFYIYSILCLYINYAARIRSPL